MTRDLPSLPKRCVSCARWGAAELPGDNAVWRWCDVERRGYAHIDFTCDAHVRLRKSAAHERLNRWSILWIGSGDDGSV